jgi:hypothetical protein
MAMLDILLLCCQQLLMYLLLHRLRILSKSLGFKQNPDDPEHAPLCTAHTFVFPGGKHGHRRGIWVGEDHDVEGGGNGKETEQEAGILFAATRLSELLGRRK